MVDTLLRETNGENVLDFFYDASGTPVAFKYNDNVYYYITNLQGDVIRLVDSHGNTAACYEYDPYGNAIDASGSHATINPLRYRGYYYDTETGLYYLQSRYYDPAVGRFINADEYSSTGLGFVGFNMFAYCNNSPVAHFDIAGQRMVCVGVDKDGGAFDYIIYYYHPESNSNLDSPAKRNHSDTNSKFIAVGSFDELVTATNTIPSSADDVFIYLHGDEVNLTFYYDLNFSAEDIQSNFVKIKIGGDIYLFSCKGGSGALASTMASATECSVIASEYKVSFGNGYARCGWKDYLLRRQISGDYAWYRFTPDGAKNPYKHQYIYP